MEFQLRRAEYYDKRACLQLCMCLSVCLSVCPQASQESHVQTSPHFLCVLCSGRGSVLLLRCCNILCTSGLVDDAMFSYYGPNGGVSLPPVLRGIGRVLS